MKHIKDDSGFQFPSEFGFTGSTMGRDDPKSARPHKDDEFGDHFARGGQKKAGRQVEHNADGSKTVRHSDGTVMHHHLDGSVEMHDSSEYAHRPKGYAVGGPAMGPPGAPPSPPLAGPPGPPPGGAAGGVGALSDMAGGAMQGISGTDKEPTITMPMSTAAKMAKGILSEGAKQGARAAVGQITELGRHQLAARSQGAHPPAGNMGPPEAGAAPPAARQAPMAQQSGAIPQMATGGKFIQSAINHPGRMKKGAAREGVSTHEYMEEHKSDSGGLGGAARLGLRMTGGDLSPHHKNRKG